MAAYRRATERRVERGLAAGIIVVVAAVALVVMLAETGGFQRFGRGSALMPSIPSLTVSDGGDDRMPVVTSVRSNGAAERAGVRVGDEIEAVNGRQVHDVAALRAIVSSDRRNQPLALHIRRGDAVWTIAIDRSEPAAGDTGMTGIVNGAENPAD